MEACGKVSIRGLWSATLKVANAHAMADKSWGVKLLAIRMLSTAIASMNMAASNLLLCPRLSFESLGEGKECLISGIY